MAGGNPERILVVRAGALGDTLMATPVVRALRQRYPGCAIDFLCAEPAAPLLQHNPHVSRVLVLRHRNVPAWLSSEKRSLARELRSARYDLAVLLESASRFRTLVERARPASLRSFGDARFDPGQHSIINNLRVAGIEVEDLDAGAVRGAVFCSPPALDMDLAVADQDERTAREWLGAVAGCKPIGMHAGYGPSWKKNRNQDQRLKGWDAENFARLARMLIERGHAIVFTGAPEDRDDAERICAGLPPERCLQLAGRTTVGQLAAVIRALHAFVSVDSGPAHMAAALAVPLVVLWGPARLEQVRPLSSRSPVRVVRHPVFCAPCYDTPMMKACRRNICMESISPARVLAEVEALPYPPH